MTKPKVKIKIKHHKRRGEWAEMRFMAMATENGLEVSKPYGEMARYDSWWNMKVSLPACR